MIANRMKSVVAALACLMLVAATLTAAGAEAAERGHRLDRHHAHHGRHFGSSEFVGNTFSGRHHRQWVRNDRWDRHNNHTARRQFADSTDLSRNRSIRRFESDRDFTGSERSGATWAGSTWAYRDDGNGVYFDRGYRDDDAAIPVFRAPRAKIIHVNQNEGSERFAARDACFYEEGVCVIRGGR
ncbi:hypothetical protein EPK99_22060 [Neorhizobium lilium]|uniref:Uncharacterized protein n=1 Tax=Neorhizobium lilium TaxID=2503024 RepID=A0A444LBU2_9HYPH|nr:hypothetical protein [Neorhizobium lilium]RWX75152.1 hypothetical protein EPK99_22060 [Neorhizobium lilium]